MKMWGSHPVLLTTSSPDDVVSGMMYEVGEREDRAKIRRRWAEYETEVCGLRNCLLLVDRKEIRARRVGYTFVWAEKGDVEVWREGNYDLKVWK